MSGWDALTVCTVALGAVVAAVVLWGDQAAAAVRAVLPAQPERPAVPPIEDLARHLRRVRRETLTPAPGAPMLRRTATMAAYDDLLLQAAHVLDVPDTLTGLAPGTDRDAERLRVEQLLREAGLVLG